MGPDKGQVPRHYQGNRALINPESLEPSSTCSVGAFPEQRRISPARKLHYRAGHHLPFLSHSWPFLSRGCYAAETKCSSWQQRQAELSFCKIIIPTLILSSNFAWISRCAHQRLEADRKQKGRPALRALHWHPQILLLFIPAPGSVRDPHHISLSPCSSELTREQGSIPSQPRRQLQPWAQSRPWEGGQAWPSRPAEQAQEWGELGVLRHGQMITNKLPQARGTETVRKKSCLEA